MKVEWLILADAAQVVGNKLYILGGGWDRLTVNKPFPIERRLALALSIRVPWNETNQNHTFGLEIISNDQTTEEPKSLMKAEGQFQVGRPAGIPQGYEQRFQLAIDVGLNIDSAGTKTVISRLNGEEMDRINFIVVPGANIARV